MLVQLYGKASTEDFEWITEKRHPAPYGLRALRHRNCRLPFFQNPKFPLARTLPPCIVGLHGRLPCPGERILVRALHRSPHGVNCAFFDLLPRGRRCAFVVSDRDHDRKVYRWLYIDDTAGRHIARPIFEQKRPRRQRQPQHPAATKRGRTARVDIYALFRGNAFCFICWSAILAH